VREGVITKTITAYGPVIPSPGAVKTLSLPYQAQVADVYVNEGQAVTKGDRLLRISPGPDAVLALKEARLEHAAAKRELELVMQRFSLKLATNQDMAAAQKALDQAGVRLKHLEDQGIAVDKFITASSDNLPEPASKLMVNKIFVGRGAIVAPGSPLLEIVTQNGREVRLGVEPEDISLIQAGLETVVSFVNRPDAPSVTGKIRAISRMVNPATRLLDVFVSLPSNLSAMLNEYAKGEIRVSSKKGLLVPRSAVLPEGKGHVVFTIKDGLAKRHVVSVGLEDHGEIEISGGGISRGDMAVVLGNYELKDGMAVTVLKAAATADERGLK
jgi:RND family efflux transporter MFP subunit